MAASREEILGRVKEVLVEQLGIEEFIRIAESRALAHSIES